MNGVIRNRTSREYLKDDGSWTLHPIQAAFFTSMFEAVQAVQRYGLRGVDFVYLMGGDSAYDMVVELTDCQNVTAPEPIAAGQPGS